MDLLVPRDDLVPNVIELEQDDRIGRLSLHTQFDISKYRGNKDTVK